MNFAQPLYAKAQQASKIYARSALTYRVSILFRIDYTLGDSISVLRIAQHTFSVY